MKKIWILGIVLFFLTGCTSYTELNDLSIVSMIAIDYQDEKYQLTIQVMDEKIEEDEIEKQLITLSSKENTLEECFHTIYQESSKRLYLSHIDLLVLTENAINHDFKNIIFHFLINNEYRNNFNVIFIDNSNVEDFISNQTSANINHLLKTNYQESGIAIPKDFEKILDELLIDGSTYLPTISINKNQLKLEGYTYVTHYKIAGQLSIKESILLNLLANQINKTYLNNTNILENQTHLKINKNNLIFQFQTTITNEDNFIEQTKKDIEDFLLKYETNNIDILKLKEKIRKNNYSYYQQEKQNLLSNITYQFHFQLKRKEFDFKGDVIHETG